MSDSLWTRVQSKGRPERFLVVYTLVALVYAFGDLRVLGWQSPSLFVRVMLPCTVAGGALLYLAETRTRWAVSYFVGMGLIMAAHTSVRPPVPRGPDALHICLRVAGLALMLGPILLKSRECKRQEQPHE